ncbi:DUF6529 family protein [Pseudonocardia spirodelae]|uniref:DUF6529 family protein n=1 Tax=Pseudonocardia spirodelae TaxID=3133431 RepID=A0ABU8T4J2_9PSEU
MSPRARHADHDTTDPVGFAPVTAGVPAPRGAAHSGGWARHPDPAADPAWGPPADLFTAGPSSEGPADPYADPSTGPFALPRPDRDLHGDDRDLYGAERRRRPGPDTGPAPARADAGSPRAAVAPPPPGPSLRAVALPVVAGSLVAVALGVWARQHVGTGVAVNLAGFSSGAAAKAWLGSAALVLAAVQGVTGRMLHRGSADPVVAVAHRWSGRVAVLVTVPVAVQCLYAFGWSGATTSALLHSALGCLFYGAFVTKMLLLRRPGVPGWALAAAGGVLLAVLAGVWLTSALWFFAGHGLTF